MSASGYKQTFQGVSQNVRFTPESRHSSGKVRFLGLKLRSTPDSRRSEEGPGWSGGDPYATCRERNGGSEKPPLMTDRHHSVVTNWKATKSLSDIF